MKRILSVILFGILLVGCTESTEPTITSTKTVITSQNLGMVHNKIECEVLTELFNTPRPLLKEDDDDKGDKREVRYRAEILWRLNTAHRLLLRKLDEEYGISENEALPYLAGGYNVALMALRTSLDSTMRFISEKGKNPTVASVFAIQKLPAEQRIEKLNNLLRSKSLHESDDAELIQTFVLTTIDINRGKEELEHVLRSNQLAKVDSGGEDVGAGGIINADVSGAGLFVVNAFAIAGGPVSWGGMAITTIGSSIVYTGVYYPPPYYIDATGFGPYYPGGSFYDRLIFENYWRFR